MRYWLQANRKLYAKIHKLMTLQIHKYYIDKAAANGIKDPKPGSISFTQRWGSALNLNVHTESESLSLATECSIAGKIAFGPNAGKYVTKIGKGFGYLEEIPLAKGTRCYSVNGFSLHANTAVNALARDRLAKLIEYIARGPLSNERLEITPDRKVKLQLKTPYSDGTTHLLFTFSEFIEKLMALVPPPKSHLVRWGGVFAPNSPVRRKITLKPDVKKGFQFGEEDGPKVFKNHSWSKMLAKAFKIDVTTCDHCGGKLKKVCAVNDRDSIRRYLMYLGIDSDPPPRSPARTDVSEFDFDHPQVDQNSNDELPTINID